MRLVFLGGFLGSGKTTTLVRIGRDLVRAGQRVGILANDQGQDLVDTELFRAAGFESRDVRGGCFCCRLDDFVAQAASLNSTLKPDVLLAEPVGSCTDLVATVFRPLRQLYPDDFEIGPFTVLVDPARARDVLSREGKATLSDKVTYIYRLQQMEADAIAINKIDQLGPEERAEVSTLLQNQFPAQRILSFSARTGEGFDDLAAWVLGAKAAGPARSPEIDYDDYAAGEAELAWYDGKYEIVAAQPLDMDDVLMALGRLLRERLAAADREIAHVKLLLRTGETLCALSIPRSGVGPELTRVAGARAQTLDLIVNARVVAQPDELRVIVEQCLASWARQKGLRVLPAATLSFSPPKPMPTHRID